MDANMIEAFKKIEAKIKHEKEKVLREERAEMLRVKQEASEKERRKQELMIYGGSLTFLFLILFLIYNANEAQIRESGGIGSWMANKMGQISNAALDNVAKEEIDCGLPANWKLPICLEEKKHELNSKWQSMALNKGSKERPFTISPPPKPEP